MDSIANNVTNDRMVKIRIEAVGGALDKAVCRYPLSFMNEMARQLTSAIEEACGVEGLAESSVELVMMFAQSTYLEHISDNVTYRRLMLIDAVSAPRDFWVKWTRIGAWEGEYSAENILFELGEDVDHKIREKEHRYMLHSDGEKYHSSMGRKKVTEWREVIKRAAKRGDLKKIESDFELTPETLQLQERIAEMLGQRVVPTDEPVKEEIPYITHDDDRYLRVMEKARMVVEENSEEDESLTLADIADQIVAEASQEEIELVLEDESEAVLEVDEIDFDEEVDEEIEELEEAEEIEEPEELEDSEADSEEVDIFTDTEEDEDEGDEVDFSEESEPDGELDVFDAAEDEPKEEIDEEPDGDYEEEPEDELFTEETEAEIEESDDELILEDEAEEIDSDDESNDEILLEDSDEDEPEEEIEEDGEENTPTEEIEEETEEEISVEETPVIIPEETPREIIEETLEKITKEASDLQPAEIYSEHITMAERVASIRAELEIKIRLEYEISAREKAERELVELRRELARVQTESERDITELVKENERLRTEYEHLVDQIEHERTTRVAEETRLRLEEQQLRAQIEMQLRAEAAERERLAESARMAIEEQHRLEAENARIARQREEEERAEEDRRRREEQEKELEALRQAELEKIRREQEEALARAKAAMPEMGDGKYSYTSKSVKFLFKNHVDPNITNRIQEIIKATVDYYGKEGVYLKIKASIIDSHTVILEFTNIPIEEMPLLGNIIKILGNSGLGISKAIVE